MNILLLLILLISLYLFWYINKLNNKLKIIQKENFTVSSGMSSTTSGETNNNNVPYDIESMKTLSDITASLLDDKTLTFPCDLNISGESNIISVGSIMATTDVKAPLGWLICDGSAYTISQYPAYQKLQLALQQNNQPNLTVPDFRGAFLRGSGTNKSNTATGPNLNSAQLDGIKSHSHNITDPGHSHHITKSGSDQCSVSYQDQGDRDTVIQNYDGNTVGSNKCGLTVSLSTNDNDKINETRPYCFGINWLIKY